MIHKHSIPLFLISLALTGAGCLGFGGSRSELEAPSHAESLYKNAHVIEDAVERTYVDSEHQRSIRTRIPAEWSGEGFVWRPRAEDRINQIRIKYFSNTPPETEWSNQQESDVHTVLFAKKYDGFYDLIVEHPALKSIIYKRFILDSPDTGRSFYLLECRVGYEADQDAMWNACKTAVESAQFEAL